MPHRGDWLKDSPVALCLSFGHGQALSLDEI
jgi:hypothetical protein